MGLTSSQVSVSLKASEDPNLGLDNVPDPTLQHSIISTIVALSPTTTPVATEVWSDDVVLSGGTVSIDLAALVRGSQLNAIDLTGLKIQMIQVQSKIANTAFVTIKPHATNGYDMFGPSGQVDLEPGGELVFFSPEGAEDVGASAKIIEITSADVDAIVSVLILAG